MEMGFRIPDSMRCIPDSKGEDYGFSKQKFARFQNPNILTWGKLLTVTDVSTTCVEVTFGVKVSCITSVDGIKL